MSTSGSEKCAGSPERSKWARNGRKPTGGFEQFLIPKETLAPVKPRGKLTFVTSASELSYRGSSLRRLPSLTYDVLR